MERLEDVLDFGSVAHSLKDWVEVVEIVTNLVDCHVQQHRQRRLIFLERVLLKETADLVARVEEVLVIQATRLFVGREDRAVAV